MVGAKDGDNNNWEVDVSPVSVSGVEVAHGEGSENRGTMIVFKPSGEKLLSAEDTVSVVPDSIPSTHLSRPTEVDSMDGTVNGGIDISSSRDGIIGEENLRKIARQELSDGGMDTTSEISVSGNFVSDKVIRRCNGKNLASKTGNNGDKIWKRCKELGVTFSGDEETMVNFVENPEARDKAAKECLGKTNGDP